MSESPGFSISHINEIIYSLSLIFLVFVRILGELLLPIVLHEDALVGGVLDVDNPYYCGPILFLLPNHPPNCLYPLADVRGRGPGAG